MSKARMMMALWEAIVNNGYTPPKFLSDQAPYRYTRAYGKRSNWIKRKR